MREKVDDSREAAGSAHSSPVFAPRQPHVCAKMRRGLLACMTMARQRDEGREGGQIRRKVIALRPPSFLICIGVVLIWDIRVSVSKYLHFSVSPCDSHLVPSFFCFLVRHPQSSADVVISSVLSAYRGRSLLWHKRLTDLGARTRSDRERDAKSFLHRDKYIHPSGAKSGDAILSFRE